MYLSNLYPQSKARTHDPKMKSCTLYQPSQPDAPNMKSLKMPLDTVFLNAFYKLNTTLWDWGETFQTYLLHETKPILNIYY